MLFVGQILVSRLNPQDVVLAVVAEFQQVPAGVLGDGMLRTGGCGGTSEPPDRPPPGSTRPRPGSC
jgi:hypothetical protein